MKKLVVPYVSVMDTKYNILVCPCNDNIQNSSVVYSNSSTSNVFIGLKHMFPSYASLFSQEDETEQKRQINNSSKASFHMKKNKISGCIR